MGVCMCVRACACYRSLMCGRIVGHHILPPFRNVTGTTGKVIRHKVCFARDMLDGKAKGLHGKVPASDSAVSVLHSLEPL